MILQKEPYLHEFVQLQKIIKNLGLHSDIYGLISLKLILLVEITKFYIMRPVWMTLILGRCEL